MGDAPLTRPSLLLRLRDVGDADAWRQFVDRYGPLVYRFAHKRGLQDADAADVTQEVMEAVCGAIQGLEYDAERGTFRGWLFTVVRHHLQKFWLRQRHAAVGTGDTAANVRLQEEPERTDDDQALWDEECDRQLFDVAMARVRGEFTAASWKAFWLTAVEGTKAPEAALVLGTTVGAVYTAKSRVLDRIRKEIRRLQIEEE